jgi:hypothetical protein
MLYEKRRRMQVCMLVQMYHYVPAEMFFPQRAVCSFAICFVMARIWYLDVYIAPHQHATTTANLPTSPYNSQGPVHKPLH